MSIISAWNDATLEVANQFKKDAPIIGIVTGIITLVASGVVAANAARDMDDILDDHRNLIDDIKAAKEEGEIDDKKANKEITRAYGFCAWRLFRRFAPAVGMAGVGTALIGVSFAYEHNRYLEANNKLAACSAALTGITADFNAYRARNRARFGEEVDNEIMYDIHREQVEETVTDEKGKEKKVKHEVMVAENVGLPGYGIYAKVFNKDANGWRNDAEENMFYLTGCEEQLNKRLHIRGKLTINEIYEYIGLRDEFDQPLKTQAGQMMGYIYDPEGNGHQIVLGIHEPINQDFVNGKTPDCVINPIPECNVWELLDD